MFQALFICAAYLLVLFMLTKYFGVKYTEILKNTNNIKKGIVYPIGIVTAVVVAFGYFLNFIPAVFTFSPKENASALWLVPLVTAVAIIARFALAKFTNFSRNDWLLLTIGAFFVGFSEELIVRGFAVYVLRDAGFSVVAAGVISSTIFGLLHFVNYFNGQDIKKTSLQVGATMFMGLNFYIIYVISGTLWLPIIAHFLYDLSIFALGYNPKIPDTIATKVISASALAMFMLPVLALFVI